MSFSEHVDKTTYKVHASVSSMTPALKSKRRRQRKAEQRRQEKQEKQESRRRRRSSGSFSEHSSADELNTGTEDESGTNSTSESSDAVPPASANATQNKENGERTSGGNSKKNKKRKNRNKGNKHGPQSVPVISGEPVVTAGSEQGKGDEPRTCEDTVHGDNKENTHSNNTKQQPTADEPEKAGDGSKVKLKKAENDSDDEAEAGKEVVSESKKGNDSVLSWKEGVGNPLENGDEPKLPKPAVVLNNSLMFDLDID